MDDIFSSPQNSESNHNVNVGHMFCGLSFSKTTKYFSNFPN